MLVVALLTENLLRGRTKTVVRQRRIGLVEGDAALADTLGKIGFFRTCDVAAVHAVVAQVHIARDGEITTSN